MAPHSEARVSLYNKI